MGATVDELFGWDGRVSRVAMRKRSGARRKLGVRLVVAADGRDSNLARLAGVPARLRKNLRLGYQMYFHGLRMPHGYGISQIWFLDGHNAYAFPNEHGITAVAAMPTKELLPEFRRDREKAYFRFIEALPDAPPVRDAEPASKLLGKLDLTNRSRPAAARGMAFIGDAATAADPVWGVGCGWALETAEWLVDATADRLQSPAGLDAGLHAYRRRHRNWLGAHNFLINDFSGKSRFSRIDRLLFAAAARDRVVARAMRRHGGRLDHPTALLRPDLLGRALRAARRDRMAPRDDAGAIHQAEAPRGAQPVVATSGPGGG
jgi:2-polyprenyl-6-methoxyphenol hydroxylase-like FAD-dependent oxidoreductase